MSDRQPRRTAWQPMDTAPLDGTPLLLFARATTAKAPIRIVGWYLPRERRWIEACFSPNQPVGIVPLLWRRLPGFPREVEGDHAGS